MVILQFMVTNS